MEHHVFAHIFYKAFIVKGVVDLLERLAVLHERLYESSEVCVPQKEYGHDF